MYIKINNVSKKYFKNKVKSLDNINIEINEGIFGLIGENGAGKTTLLKTISTIMGVEEGSVKINGLDVKNDTGKIRKMIGYLPQHFEFFNALTIYEMLDYIGTLKGINTNDRHTQITELIEDFNLVDKTNAKISALSGGMKQRVAIAQSLLGDPKVVIMDEPTVGLDPKERLRFRNVINKRSKGKIIIISTHIISDIEIMCEEIAMLKKGHVKYCGTISDVLNEMEGKVYVDVIDRNEKIDREKYKNIISIRRKKNNVEVRFILEEDSSVFAKVTPTIEDAYFHKMF